MPETATCPKCGAVLPADAPGGLCPQCLLAAGLAGPSQAAGVPTTDQPPAGRFVPPTPAELAPAFPQLEILELLGSGGMGAVYKARQPHLDRLVALKILPPQLAQDPAFEERFLREARTLAKLNHPHIVAVYDFGSTQLPAGPASEGMPAQEGRPLYFFLMEYVDGASLRQVMQQGQLQPQEALAIVPQICAALQYAHDQGVVHRDIKPENILLDRQGRVKIADFGLAKIAGQPPAGEAAVVGQPFTLTATGQVMGTPHYMAPEQLRGSHDVDHRADIYSLGVVFYEMLTGELPIGKFAPPSRKVQVDVRLDEVVLRALENEPERRYQRVSEVKTEVETISRQASSKPSATLTPGHAHAGRSGFDVACPVPPAQQFPLILGCAIGMVLGGLMMAAGVALAVYALLSVPAGSGEFWGWVGGAFGCFFGGGGSLIGSWNSYRQLSGVGDLLRVPQRTWLDYLLWAYTLIGAGLLAASLVMFFLGEIVTPTAQGLLTLGGVMVSQGVLFLVFRALMRQHVSEGKSEVETISRQAVQAAPGPAPAGLFSVLEQAWKQWWMERPHWFAQTVQGLLLLVHFICLLAFISWHGTTTWDDQGRPRRTIEVGFSDWGFSPWFIGQTWPEATTAFRWNIHLSSSLLFLAVGLLAYAAVWRIEKTRNPNAGKPGFWRTWRGACVGTPVTIAILWAVLTSACVGFAIWFTVSDIDARLSSSDKIPVATVRAATFPMPTWSSI
jgi:serine/threonine protein kinase